MMTLPSSSPPHRAARRFHAVPGDEAEESGLPDFHGQQIIGGDIAAMGGAAPGNPAHVTGDHGHGAGHGRPLGMDVLGTHCRARRAIHRLLGYAIRFFSKVVRLRLRNSQASPVSARIGWRSNSPTAAARISPQNERPRQGQLRKSLGVPVVYLRLG